MLMERERRAGVLAVLAPGAVLYALLRLPAFFQPHWYSDEAGYMSEGRALLQGHLLYHDAWTNKPPVHVWTIAISYLLFGISEAGLHLMTFITGLVALSAVAYAATRLLGRARALVAVVLAALLLGSTLFAAELALPENFLIAGTTWAGAVVLTHVRRDTSVWPVVAGLLVALGLAYQQTVIADAAALGAIILLAAPRPARQLVLYVAAVLLGTATWLVPTLVISGAGSTFYSLVVFFVGFTAAVLPTSLSGVLLDFGLLVASTALILAGCALVRTRDVRLWGTWMWAGATILIEAAAHQPYGHYLVPSLAPVSLALASLPRPRLPSRRGGLAISCLVAGIGIALLVANTVRNGATLADPGSVLTYYRGAAGVATGRWTLEDWQRTFNRQVVNDQAACGYITSHHLAGARAVVWASDAWPYLECDLQLGMPTAPIYNDEILLGCRGPVADRVAAFDPEVIITANQSVRQYPEIRGLLAARYHRVLRSGSTSVWLLDPGTTTRTWAGANRGPGTCLPPLNPPQRGLFSALPPAIAAPAS